MEEKDGLHCHRYALKLTCQTLKVCTLTHASMTISPTMQCSIPLSENEAPPRRAGKVDNQMFNFSLFRKGFKSCMIYFFYCAVFMRKAL